MTNATSPQRHTAPMLRSVVARVVDATLEASVVGSFTRLGPMVRSRTERWCQPAVPVLAGTRAVVTGATSGIGGALARRLVDLGAEVHAVGRSADKVDATVADLSERGTAMGHVADLERLADVRRLADDIGRDRPLHLLAHVAGMLVDERSVTEDDLESTAQVHVVAPFLLTSLLFDALAADGDARVVTMASGGMYSQRLDVDALFDPPEPFDGTAAYARAKRAQVELTAAWAQRHPDRGIGFHACHPGWVDTPGLAESLPRFRRIVGPLLREPEDGADTAAWLAWTDRAHPPGGNFWHDRRRRRTVWLPQTATAPDERDRLLDATASRAGDAHEPGPGAHRRRGGTS